MNVYMYEGMYIHFHFHLCAGASRPIIEIKDGQEIKVQAAQHFCYNNTIIPRWRETWTRIQVKNSNYFNSKSLLMSTSKPGAPPSYLIDR